MIEWQLDSPIESRFRPRDAKVTGQLLDRVNQFGLAKRRANKIWIRAQKLQQPFLVLAKFEIVILFFAKLDLAPFRAKLAVRSSFFVGEKLFLPHAVVTSLLIFIDLFFVPQPLQHFLYTFLVQRIGRHNAHRVCPTTR